MKTWNLGGQKIRVNNLIRTCTMQVYISIKGMFINENLVFCIYEARGTVSDAEFQEFIDGPSALGVHMGLYPEKPWNNTCHKINPSLGGNNPPFEPYFED